MVIVIGQFQENENRKQIMAPKNVRFAFDTLIEMRTSITYSDQEWRLSYIVMLRIILITAAAIRF